MLIGDKRALPFRLAQAAGEIEMTSTIVIDRRREPRWLGAAKRSNNAPALARARPSPLGDLLTLTAKSIRLTLALAVILAFEIGDSCL
jgi:hypothetical protein